MTKKNSPKDHRVGVAGSDEHYQRFHAVQINFEDFKLAQAAAWPWECSLRESKENSAPGFKTSVGKSFLASIWGRVIQNLISGASSCTINDR